MGNIKWCAAEVTYLDLIDKVCGMPLTFSIKSKYVASLEVGGKKLEKVKPSIFYGGWMPLQFKAATM